MPRGGGQFDLFIMSGADESYRIDAVMWQILENEALKTDLELWISTKQSGQPVVPQLLASLFGEAGLTMSDATLAKVLKALADMGWRPTKSKPDVAKEVAVIKHKGKINTLNVTKINLRPSFSSKQPITGVWRLIEGLSTKTEVDSHIFAIRWDRTAKGREGMGILTVVFRTGGRIPRTAMGGASSLPAYSYSPVTYDQYYHLWKRAGSPGTWVYRFAKGSTGIYIGNISVSKMIYEATEERNRVFGERETRGRK